MTEPVEVKPRFATPPVSEPQARPHTRPEFQSQERKGGFMNFVSQNKFTILVIVLMIIIILVLLYFFVWSKSGREEKIDRGGGNESYDGRNAGGYQQLQTRLSQPMPGQPGHQPGGQPGHQPGQPGQPSQSSQDSRPESQSSPEKWPSLTREELIEKLARANKNLTKTEQTAQEPTEVEQEYELREQDDRDDEYITD